MKWAAQQRQNFIRERVNERGTIGRSEIMKEFEISIAQASQDITAFREKFPGIIEYDFSKKTWVKK